MSMMRDLFVLLVTLVTSVLLSSIFSAQISSAQQQPQQFSSATTAKQVVDAYKAGIPFKKYIENAVKSSDSPDNTIIRNQLSSGNVACGGSDAITKVSICDGIV